MKLIIRTLTDEQLEARDYRDAIEFQIEKGPRMSFWDGEPEDANMARDFAAVGDIGLFMKLAWEAGRAGEGFEVVQESLELG